ncbi:MAG: replicative DNA helicase [Sedimentisphaerales bacterium]|nr:replicative DNA helicase [Sedimentisphaerales bacterium]
MSPKNPVNPQVNESADAALATRVPPQSLEAEMGVLGSMLIDSQCIAEVIPMLQAESFYRQEHRTIYHAVLTLYEANKPVDIVLLRDELKRQGQLEQIGGVDYLVRVVESVPSAANAVYYAGIVRDKHMLRELITAAGEITLRAFEDRGDVSDTLDQAEQRVFDVTQRKIVGHARPIKEIIHQVYESIDERRGSHIYGLATGFDDLNGLTGGLQKSEMIIVAARPSMGKTALGLNIAEHVGADNKIAAAVFSLEMSSQQLAERMLCGRAHIDAQKMRKGMMSDHEVADMHAAAQELSEAPIFVDDSPGLTPLELRAKCRRLKLQHDIQLVVVDYLQLMYVPGSESRQQEVSTISRHMKALARELDVPVMVLSQLNRSPEGREGHRPRMSDLRESGAIEQDADVVILLHREDYYHNEPDYEKTNTAEIIIAKQRNGPTGQVELTWMSQFTRFENLSRVATGEFGV